VYLRSGDTENLHPVFIRRIFIPITYRRGNGRRPTHWSRSRRLFL